MTEQTLSTLQKLMFQTPADKLVTELNALQADLAKEYPGACEERKAEIGRGRVGKECRSRWSPYH